MNSPERSVISSATPTPTSFYSQKLQDFIFLMLDCWAMRSGLGMRLLTPQGVPSGFYLPHMNVGLTILPATDAAASPPPTTPSLPRLPVSTSPTHLDEYFFFKSLIGLLYSSIFWKFQQFFVLRLVVILLMVVRGGKACLLTPPSWPAYFNTFEYRPKNGIAEFTFIFEIYFPWVKNSRLTVFPLCLFQYLKDVNSVLQFALFLPRNVLSSLSLFLSKQYVLFL